MVLFEGEGANRNHRSGAVYRNVKSMWAIHPPTQRTRNYVPRRTDPTLHLRVSVRGVSGGTNGGHGLGTAKIGHIRPGRLAFVLKPRGNFWRPGRAWPARRRLRDLARTLVLVVCVHPHDPSGAIFREPTPPTYIFSPVLPSGGSRGVRTGGLTGGTDHSIYRKSGGCFREVSSATLRAL